MRKQSQKTCLFGASRSAGHRDGEEFAQAVLPARVVLYCHPVVLLMEWDFSFAPSLVRLLGMVRSESADIEEE